MGWWLVQHLATVTLLIAVVHLASRAFSLGPVARHALWVVVLVKLVTPPLVTWPWAIHERAQSAELTHQNSATTGSQGLFSMLIEVVAPGGHASTPTPATAAAHPWPEPSWSNLALIGWLAGSLIFGLVQAGRTVRLARVVKRSTAPPSDTLDRLAADVASTLGVHNVPVQVVDGLASPMVWALRRPRLLWPSALTSLDVGAARPLLTHELAHIKRRDHWAGWLDLAAGIIWWWTPMYWHSRRHLRQQAELSCDAWAARSCDGDRRSYANALLALCAAPPPPDLPTSALGIHTDDRRFLERRLTVIMRSDTQLRLSRPGLCAVIVATGLALPAFAQRQEPAVGMPVEARQPPAGRDTPSPAAVGRPVAGSTAVVTAYPRAAAAGAQGLPTEALALLSSYNETALSAQRETDVRLARERKALIDKLEKIQETETKAGHLDAAIAIRDRVRQLQSSARTRQLPLAEPTAEPFAAGLVAQRDRVGTTFDMNVVGSAMGSVWGSGIYTDDSSVEAAAVHAGVLKPGQAGTVHVTILPGQQQYVRSLANGVSSNAYGAWPGSFAFAGTSASGAARADSQLPFGRSLGSVVLEVTGSLDGHVWGSDVYTDDSSVAAAAVHQGLLLPGETGTIEVIAMPGRERYVGSTRNGVKSSDWGAWQGSVRLLRRVAPDPPLSSLAQARPARALDATLPPFHPEVARPAKGLTNPVVLTESKPVYTPEAMRARIAGSVAVEILIDRTGVVTDARVSRSLDDQFGLDREALNAARLWTFRPARDANNEPIPMVAILELQFRIRPTPDGTSIPATGVPPSKEQK